MRTKLAVLAVSLALLLACSQVPIITTPTAGPTPTATPVIPTLAAPTPTEAPSPSPAPTVPPPSGGQFIAYVSDGQLLVTDISNGTIGGTTQYTMAGESDKVYDIVWSPSGQFIAFVASPKGDEHVFYIYAEGASTPTDLGPGSSPAWSPDSQTVAYIGGTYPDNSIWVTSIDNPAPRQLTYENNHAWGRPAFTPDGQALIVSTADRFNMGAQGNTSFTLERLTINGGVRTALPGATSLDGVRLPYDLRFSPDGTRLAFSTSAHLSACASPGAYYVSNADGANRQALVSPSLAVLLDPTAEHYFVGLSYGWMPSGQALVATGTVVDCNFNSPNMGKEVAGPQMSVLRLDGSEGTIIPGMFWSPSVDRTGQLIAAAHYKELGDQDPLVEVYSAQTGQIVMKLGPGNTPQLQP